MKYAWIQEHTAAFPVNVMCQVLQVSRSGYYAWKDRPVSERQCRHKALVAQIRQVHATARGLYGSPRIYQELLEQQVAVCENTVAKLMAQADLRAKTCRKFKVQTTDANHAYPVAANRLAQCFTAGWPNTIWCTDITYIPTAQGWLYLAAVLDVCSRKIVGWAMAGHLRAELCTEALQMAVARRRPGSGLLHHSDRGVQYACREYQELLAQQEMTCSMSRRGNCYDNAVMESFWGTLKTELIYLQRYATRDQARAAIFEYIEVFYNRKRRHSALGYQSPEAFEAGLN